MPEIYCVRDYGRGSERVRGEGEGREALQPICENQSRNGGGADVWRMQKCDVTKQDSGVKVGMYWMQKKDAAERIWQI